MTVKLSKHLLGDCSINRRLTNTKWINDIWCCWLLETRLSCNFSMQSSKFQGYTEHGSHTTQEWKTSYIPGVLGGESVALALHTASTYVKNMQCSKLVMFPKSFWQTPKGVVQIRTMQARFYKYKLWTHPSVIGHQKRVEVLFIYVTIYIW